MEECIMKNSTIFRGMLIVVIIVTLTACNMNRQQGTGQQHPQDNNVRNFANNFTNTAERDLSKNNKQNNKQKSRQNHTRGTQNSHNNTTVEMSQEVAERIAAMPEVERANVLLTNRNAYIAVVVSESTRKDNDNTKQRTNQANRGGGFVEREFDVMNAPDEVSDQLKDRIAKQVQSMNPDVNNVYVSTNPDFVDRTNDFMQQVQEGRPVRGFIEEFNTMVERIFPENSGQR